MARILVFTLGTRGDVQPFAALGGELARRGHAVSFATGQGFDTLARSLGMAAEVLPLDVRAMMDAPETRAALTSMRGRLWMYRSTRALMQRQLDAMWDVVRRVRPEIVVHHPKGYLVPWLARATGAVAVPGFLQPFHPPTGLPSALAGVPDLGGPANRALAAALVATMRAALGSMLRQWLPRHPEVPDRPRLHPLDGYDPRGRTVPRLHGWSSALVPRPPTWRDRDRITGAWHLGPPAGYAPPPELAAFLAAGPPPVYIGFGSMPEIGAEHPAGAVAAALRRTGTRALVDAGWGALAAADGGPGMLRIDGGVPHDWLLPRCAAIVHHGGAGTTHAGLRHGLPTLVCPLSLDQPFWARRVHRLGACPPPIPLRRLSADRLAPALAALTAPEMRAAAAGIARGMRLDGGAPAAADAVEEML